MSESDRNENKYDPFDSRMSNSEHLASLVRSLEYAKEFAILFAVCNNNDLRSSIIGDIRKRLPGLVIEDVPLWEETRNLYHVLRDKYEESERKPDVIMLYGMEAWLPSGKEGENTPFVKNLNVTRDHFPRLLKSPAVFWVSEYGLSAIAYGAPDFFSARSGIFTFTVAPGESRRMEGIIEAIGLEGVSGLTYEERLSRAERLERLLNELQSEPEEKRDLAAERRILRSAAETFYVMARYDKAEPLLRRLLAADEASFGSDHPEVAADLNNLAQLLRATNRLGEAEPLIRRALSIEEASSGKDHPNVAAGLNNLAQLLQATNRLGEAEPLMRRVVQIFETSLGESHPEVATSLSNLATLLHDTDRLGEAEPLMRRALLIHEASFGKVHPTVAVDLNNLAGLFRATNRLGEAEPLMRRVVQIFETSLGKDHPNVATSLNNLAQLLQDTNRLGEAEPLMRRAMEIFRKSLGDDHPSTQTVAGNYELLTMEMKKGK